VDDLVRRGFDPGQIRFFLAYTHYRKRINFTWQKMQRNIVKLEQLRSEVKELSHHRTDLKGSRVGDDNMALNLAREFRNHMDNDLDFQGAFEAILRDVKRINRLQSGVKLGSKTRRALLDELKRIDRVLCIIG
jgi:cysteinyl-tRNA synthetase